MDIFINNSMSYLGPTPNPATMGLDYLTSKLLDYKGKWEYLSPFLLNRKQMTDEWKNKYLPFSCGKVVHQWTSRKK